jgi:hypothetical protein
VIVRGIDLCRESKIVHRKDKHLSPLHECSLKWQRLNTVTLGAALSWF